MELTDSWPKLLWRLKLHWPELREDRQSSRYSRHDTVMSLDQYDAERMLVLTFGYCVLCNVNQCDCGGHAIHL